VQEQEKYAIVNGDGLEVTPKQHLLSAQQFSLGPPFFEKQQQRSRGHWNWLLTGGVFLLLVILAAVVGGVLGSRKSTTASTSTSTSTSPPSSNIAVAQHERAVAAVSCTKSLL
jgi:hypothetical protein